MNLWRIRAFKAASGAFGVTQSKTIGAPISVLASALLRGVWGAVLIASLTVSFVISFTAIIYSGSLAPFLGTGIGLALLGSIFMCGIGGFFYTFRGTICHPQDVTAIVLAVSATSIAAAWPQSNSSGLLATIVMLVTISTAVAGITAYLFGYFRLGFLARFIPYPVVGGFLVATGYLLAIGAIGMGLGATVEILDPPPSLRTALRSSGFRGSCLGPPSRSPRRASRATCFFSEHCW
jgi:MFS superfamily sulfate permease-like transporter